MCPQSIGNAICNSAKLIKQIGQETDSLFELIQNRFNTTLFDSEEKTGIKIVQGWGYDSFHKKNDWLLNEYAYTLGIAKRKDVIPSFLWIQLSLLGDENEFEEMKVNEPLVHICFLGHDLSYSDETYININDINDPDYINEYPIALDHDFFWHWVNEKNADPLKQEWYYSLKLTSLNSVDDVEQKIINPVKSLLLATNASEKDNAIQKLSNLDGILRYKKVDEKYVAENG
mgnify:CR=1 FL=1